MPTNEEMNAVLSAYGINAGSSGFSAANFMAWLIFGVIGLCAFNFGRKEKNYKILGIGLALMIYPYFVSATLWLYVIGIAIASLLYFLRD